MRHLLQQLTGEQRVAPAISGAINLPTPVTLEGKVIKTQGASKSA